MMASSFGSPFSTMDEDIIIFENGEPNELAISVLQESANILTGAYLSAISDFTNIKMATTVPFLSIDMAAATLVTGLVELSNEIGRASCRERVLKWVGVDTLNKRE